MNRILLVEDERIFRQKLRADLERASYEVSEAASIKEARSKFNLKSFDLVLTDLRLPGEDGSALITLAAPVPVVVMTAYGSIQNAVSAMQLGAEDYIEKSPLMFDELRLKLERWLPRYDVASDLIGDSPQMCALREQIRKLAGHRSMGWRVLIQGRTGTGKELVARALHRLSARADKKFVAINCASFSESLIESELFGHKKGAFSNAACERAGVFREAHGGTLFLDEIGELKESAQAKLLRTLETGTVRPVGFDEDVTVDVRVVAATLRDLSVDADNRRFREDLFWRLEKLQINVPTLRERRGDIPALAEHFLKRHAEENGEPIRTLTEQAIERLLTHPWPGNVRELRSVVERAAMTGEGEITPQLLVFRTPSSSPESSPSSSRRSTVEAAAPPHARSKLEEDQYLFENYLRESQREMGRALGRSGAWVNRRMKDLGLPSPSNDDDA